MRYQILISTYQLAFQSPGGGERLVLETARALESLGHQVYFDTRSTPLPPSIDLIHSFSVLEPQRWATLQQHYPNAPHVVTPILHPHPDQLFTRVKRMLSHGLAKFQSPAFWPASYRAKSIQHWFPATQVEAQFLGRSWGVEASRITVIPNAVSVPPSPDPSLFKKRYPHPSEFLLQVGRFDPVKNQLRLIEAAREHQVPLVLIGPRDLSHPGYLDQCRSAAQHDPQILILDDVPPQSDLLFSAYAASRGLILPSEFETFGMVPHEAIRCGTPRLWLTSRLGSRDYLKGQIHWFDPSQLSEVLRTIQNTWATPVELQDRPQSLLPSWLEVATEIQHVYSRLIQRKN